MRIFSFLVLVSFAFACGDDDSSDAGGQDVGAGDTFVAADAGTSDSGSGDAIPETDTGPALDSGGVDSGGVDARPDEDAGSDAGGIDANVDSGPAGPCDGLAIGRECPCRGGFVCVEGRCMPEEGRATCGGIAGVMCTTRAFPECTYFPGADFGPCLSTVERACVCAEHRDLFVCPRM